MRNYIIHNEGDFDNIYRNHQLTRITKSFTPKQADQVLISGTIKEFFSPFYTYKKNGMKIQLLKSKIEFSRTSGKTDSLTVAVPLTAYEKFSRYLEKDSTVVLKGYLHSKEIYTNNQKCLVLFLMIQEINLSLKPVNLVKLEGYVCKSPIVRTVGSKTCCNLLLCTSISSKIKSYISCVFWNDNADIAKKLEVGHHVKLLGRIESRKFKDKNYYEVSAFRILD